MHSLVQLDIPRRNAQCAHQGEPLLPGMDIYSLLYEENGTKKIVRKDVCSTCWANFKDKGTSKGYWKSKIEKKKSTETPARAVRALGLFKTLLSSPNIKEDEIFVLSLYLAHARQIAMRKEFQNENSTYYLYEIPRSEEFFTVKTVNLSPLQIEQIQKSLAVQLDTAA